MQNQRQFGIATETGWFEDKALKSGKISQGNDSKGNTRTEMETKSEEIRLSILIISN